MSDNPEQPVIDAIDQLVNDQMANYHNRSGYDHNVNQETCTLCGGTWHGIKWAPTGRQWLDDTSRRSIGCPGAHATGPQRIRFRRSQRQPRLGIKPGALWIGPPAPDISGWHFAGVMDPNGQINIAIRVDYQSIAMARLLTGIRDCREVRE